MPDSFNAIKRIAIAKNEINTPKEKLIEWSLILASDSPLIDTKLKTLSDINKSEIIMMATLAFFVIFFGFYPMPLMETFSVSVNGLIDNYQLALNNR